jgi:hypothetical protein
MAFTGNGVPMISVIAFAVAANGFGAPGNEVVSGPSEPALVVETNPCEECICANDAGDYDDPSDKKCCVSQGAGLDEWDGFCDGLAMIVCKDECTDNGKARMAMLPWLESVAKREAHEGDICGQETFEGDGQAECEAGLFCHQASPDSDIRVCASIAYALHNLADEEEGGLLLEDLTPDDSSDHFFGLDPSKVRALDSGSDEILKALAERLGTDVEKLSFGDNGIIQHVAPLILNDSDEVLRKQNYPCYPGYPVYPNCLYWGSGGGGYPTPSPYGGYPTPYNGYPTPYNGYPTPYNGGGGYPTPAPFPSGGGGTGGCPNSNNYACRTMSTQEAQSISNNIANQGVQLIGWDWDQTANSEHTYQKSYSSYKQVEDAISQQFVGLANKWCAEGRSEAIVTYSNAQVYNMIGGQMVRGTDMIRKVLDKVLDYGCGSKMQIYGRNDSGMSPGGKTWHLQSAQRHYSVTNNANVMLFDDDGNNINIALGQGYKTNYVTPKAGYASQTSKMNQRA